MSQFVMANDTQHFDLPSELWFKVIAFVLSHSIHSVCCPTTGGADLSWERNAFATLRLVSKSFSHVAFKVADLALAGRFDGEEDESMDVDGDEIMDDPDKLKYIFKCACHVWIDSTPSFRLIHDRFKMINDIHSDQNILNFFSQSGTTILSAYYGYVQVIKNCKTFFSRSGLFSGHPDLEIDVFLPASQQHLAFIERILTLFSKAIKNILSTLDVLAVPEMVEKLRRDVEWDSRFIISGLEIVHRCAQVIDRQDEWLSPNISKLCAQGSCSGRVSNYLEAAGS
ncbi:hypothetical protein JOM56_011403 [Amanita muscaria]